MLFKVFEEWFRMKIAANCKNIVKYTLKILKTYLKMENPNKLLVWTLMKSLSGNVC